MPKQLMRFGQCPAHLGRLGQPPAGALTLIKLSMMGGARQGWQACPARDTMDREHLPIKQRAAIRAP